MKKQLFRLRKPGMNIPLSGGFRVTESGLIEVLEDSTVLWGLHNNICSTFVVKAGYLFNSDGDDGSSFGWNDVIPKYRRADKKYFKRVGDGIPDTRIRAMNRKNKTVISEHWSRDE